MKILKIINILFIGGFFGCQTNYGNNEVTAFSPPGIINTQFGDTITTISYNEKNVSEVSPLFAGKYKFQDEIDINPEKMDTTFYRDFLSGYSRNKLLDSVDVNGFEVIVDYATSINDKCFFF